MVGCLRMILFGMILGFSSQRLGRGNLSRFQVSRSGERRW